MKLQNSGICITPDTVASKIPGGLANLVYKFCLINTRMLVDGIGLNKVSGLCKLYLLVAGAIIRPDFQGL